MAFLQGYHGRIQRWVDQSSFTPPHHNRKTCSAVYIGSLKTETTIKRANLYRESKQRVHVSMVYLTHFNYGLGQVSGLDVSFSCCKIMQRFKT